MMQSKRDYFSLDESVVYLNCAYKAPLLRNAEVAITNAMVRERNPYQITVDDFFDDSDAIKENMAKIVGTEARNIALIPSTSYGFANALSNVIPKPNGKAITIKDEFPSGYFAISKWCSNTNSTLEIVESTSDAEKIGRSWNENILAAIDHSTSVVLISAIHWMNGVKFDLRAIGEKCREVNAFFIVDGTQAVGAIPFEVEKFNIDALICASYKWLYGPYSCGVAYYGKRFENGNPIEESWMNRTNAREFSELTNYDDNYADGAARFSVGESSNFLLLPMLKEGVRQINEWGVANIQAYCKELVEPLFLYLNDIGAGLEEEEYMCFHLFSLRLPNDVDVDQLKLEFQKRNIYISVRGSFIRISVNMFNTDRDIDTLIEAIEEVRKVARIEA